MSDQRELVRAHRARVDSTADYLGQIDAQIAEVRAQFHAEGVDLASLDVLVSLSVEQTLLHAQLQNQPHLLESAQRANFG